MVAVGGLEVQTLLSGVSDSMLASPAGITGPAKPYPQARPDGDGGASSRMLSIFPQEANTRSTKAVPTANGERVCEIVLADVADKLTGNILHKSRIHVSEEIKGKEK